MAVSFGFFRCTCGCGFRYAFGQTAFYCPRCGKQTELTLAAPRVESAVPRKAIVWTVVALVILALGVIVPVVGLKHFEKMGPLQEGATFGRGRKLAFDRLGLQMDSSSFPSPTTTAFR